ncbi:MAG: hypothetical protein KME64_23930 [Scytonematopsis contorta HA4267-MV1]|jgi:MoxR-like ATPase|nr:hypothetical protein [Scytonematopsis contorta HA4267-MV1]
MKEWRYFYGDGKIHSDIKIEQLPPSPPWRQFRDFEKMASSEKTEIDERWKKIRELADSEENQRGYQQVLLIDEIDKSDINLPNDLLDIFEEGAFNIRELTRRADNSQTERVKVCTEDRDIKADIYRGRVRCAAFPIVIMTSNGEREFPPAFLRRCLRVKMPDPQTEALKAIVKAHFGEVAFKKAETEVSKLITEFLKEGDRSTDQLLNTVYLLTNHVSPDALDRDALQALLFKRLSTSDEL